MIFPPMKSIKKTEKKKKSKQLTLENGIESVAINVPFVSCVLLLVLSCLVCNCYKEG